MRSRSLVPLVLLAAAALAKPPVIGFVRVDADKYFAEDQRHHPYATRVLRPNGFEFGLAEWRLIFGDQADPQRTLELYRRFNVVVLDNPFDMSIVDLGAENRAHAAAARAAPEA